MRANLFLRFAVTATMSALLGSACSGSDGGGDEEPDAGELGDASTGEGDAAAGDGDGDAGTMDAGPGDAGAQGDAAASDAGSEDDASVTMDGAVGDGGPENDGGGGGGADAGEGDAGVDAGPCIPATEVCNAQDDDCDGLTDEGLLAMSADDTRNWDLPSGEMLTDTQRGFSQLLPRTGGAWLLTKALPESDGVNGINVMALDAQGAQVGAVQTVLASSRVFIGASLGNQLAILWRDTDNDGDATSADLASSKTHVTLFEAAADNTLSEVDSLELTGPADISEIELQRTAGGELRILLSYGLWADVATGALGRTVVQTLRLDTSAMPDELVSVASVELPANARPTVHAIKRPCGEGWLLAYWTNNGTTNSEAERILYVRPVTLDGAIDLGAAAPYTLTGRALRGLAVAPENCAAESTPLLLLGDSPEPSATEEYEAYQLSFSHDDGSLVQTAMNELLTNESGFSRATYYGGQWYVTVRAFATAPTGVYELDVVGNSKRQIATPVDHGGLSALTPADVNMFFIPTQDILAVGSGMLIAFSNARPWESPLGRETVAVTHRLTCQ